MSLSELDKHGQRFYSDKPGKVLFFNYINGCRQDVVNLKKKMTDLGWVCEDVNADSLEDLRNISKGKGGYSGTIMVFFFGYGYTRQLFLGQSTKESISHDVFYEELKKFQTKDEALILFTTTCYKKPNKNTYQHVKISKMPYDVFHSSMITNGRCKKGSLMSFILLNKTRHSEWDISDLAIKFAREIRKRETWKGNKYRSCLTRCGVIDTIFINFKPLTKL